MSKKQTVDIAKYHRDYLDRYKDKDKKEAAWLAIQKEHIARVKQGKGAWNAWAEQVEDVIQEEINARYPHNNASEEEELAIRNAYKINFGGGKLEESFASFNFPIAVAFLGITFSGGANFLKATFFGDTKFSFVIFPGSTRKSGGTKFFAGTLFDKADFQDTIFSGDISFLNIKFSREVDFQGATFSREADFQNTRFSRKANFSKATFSKEANFRDATFSGEANFRDATFSGEADFSNSKEADFEEAMFSGKANFQGATFSGKANFFRTTFSKDAHFIRAHFHGGVDQAITFKAAEFKARCLFSDIQFGNEALAYPVNFLETRFAEPPLVDNFPSDWERFKEATADKALKGFDKDHEGQFRRLKKLAEGNNHHLKATEFYACELYSHYRASGGTRNWSNGANFIYRFFSGYGLSFLKPVGWWLIIMVLALGGQVSIDLLKGTDKKSEFFSAERVMFYIGPSFSPINHIDTKYPSEVRKRLYPANPAKNRAEGQMPALVRILRFIQSVFSLVMSFLMALALRNRFKIG